MTNFLWTPGGSNSGLLASAITLLGNTSELSGLVNSTSASTGLVTSSVNGSSGLFTNANTAQAIWGEIFLTLGAIGSALSAGANIAGWFLTSPDSNTTLEATTLVPPRSPDFIIPLPATTISASATIAYKAPGLVRIPSLQFKVLVQNNTGQTLANSSNNVLKLAPIAVQY